MSLRRLVLACAFGAAALVTTPALAATIDLGLGEIGITMLDANGYEIWSDSASGTQDPKDPNVYNVGDGGGTYGGLTISWEDVSIDIDPGVSGNWAITNNTLAPQILTLIVDAPVLPVAPSSLMFGSTSISIADANFDGTATLATVGVTALYNGRIDLVAVTPTTDLFAAPFSLPAPPGGTASATLSFGAFPGSVPGPAVAGFIGIQHTFSLSPGDRATFNSTFHLIVPEPGTLLLLGASLVLLAVRRSN